MLKFADLSSIFESMNRAGMRLKQRGRERGRRREEGIGSCRDSMEWRHTPLGAAGMHPFVLAACRLGCKQWQKSCIVAARIVSRKAVTLSSGSCALPTSPYPGSLAIPFSWFQGWKGPPIPATDTYVSAEKANSEISFTEYYLSKRMAGLFAAASDPLTLFFCRIMKTVLMMIHQWEKYF